MKKTNLKVISFGIRVSGGTVFLQYLHRRFLHSLPLRNPEVLTGRLVRGAELAVTVHSGRDRGISDDGPQVELHLSDDDLLPPGFIAKMKPHMPALRTPFGLISKPEGEEIRSGRYYLLRDQGSENLLLCTGRYEILENEGMCGDFDGTWEIRPGIMENLIRYFFVPAAGIRHWRHPSADLQRADTSGELKDLTAEEQYVSVLMKVYDQKWIEEWDPLFYRIQAKMGFISIAGEWGGEYFLAPELQETYAVLDWEDLVIDKGVQRIFLDRRIEAECVRLRIDPDPGMVLQHLDAVWGDRTWLYPPFTELMKNLASSEEREKDDEFRIWGVTLRVGPDAEIAAGELGYTIGNTYTSLSGFFHRENRAWNHFGKLQLVLLARKLQEAGIAFWNLGHPYMDYKTRLGARIIPRKIFLERWAGAARGKSPDLRM